VDDDLIRVLIVDDHPVVREGLRAVLSAQPGILVVAESAEGTDAVRLALELRPNVVLMDLRLAGMDGIEATREIVAAQAGHVLVLTTFHTDGDIVRVLAAGACGYLLKDAPRAVLVDAVRATARGEIVLAPPVVARLATRVSAPTVPALTPRELQVLRGISRGLSNPDIGRELFIGETTVKSHVARIFDKLGVTDRTAAATCAIARGVIPPPDERT
jgi:DNA-binding NarL/FixJ family response regulator